MMQFFSEMMKLPVAIFVFSMEMFVKTMQGIQEMVDQGIDTMVRGTIQTPGDPSDSKDDLASAVTDGALGESVEATPQTTQKEKMKMPDQDLHGDNELKLVRYKILFVKRDLEHAFYPEKEELVAESIDATGYTAWKIAEFIQELNTVPIPKKWRDKKYPRDVANQANPMIGSLDEEDKKYLRVYFEVLERYPREKFKYEERQIEVLEQIRDKL
jgi:hypothetical protein